MASFASITQLPIGSAATSESFSLSAESGTYALSMHGAAKLITDIYPSGVYLLNGHIVDLKVGYAFSLDSGSFALSGTDAETENRTDNTKILLDVNFGVPAETGVFTLTGQDVELDSGFGLVAEAGSYVVTSNNVNLNISMAVPSVSYVVTGQDTAQKITEVIDAGSFNVVLHDNSVFSNRIITADSGSYSKTVFKVRFRGFLSPEPARPEFIDAVVPEGAWTAGASNPLISWNETYVRGSDTWAKGA